MAYHKRKGESLGHQTWKISHNQSNHQALRPCLRHVQAPPSAKNLKEKGTGTGKEVLIDIEELNSRWGRWGKWGNGYCKNFLWQ